MIRSNKEAVIFFFLENLKTLTKVNNFALTNLFNLHESFLRTVKDRPKIITPDETKLVVQMILEERGSFTTKLVFVAVSRNKRSPCFVFSRIYLKRHLPMGAHIEIQGLSNPSNYITIEVFEDHFIVTFRWFPKEAMSANYG